MNEAGESELLLDRVRVGWGGGSKTGATRLGCGLLLKFFEQEGRSLRHSGEVPKAAVDYVADEDVPAEWLADKICPSPTPDG